MAGMMELRAISPETGERVLSGEEASAILNVELGSVPHLLKDPGETGYSLTCLRRKKESMAYQTFQAEYMQMPVMTRAYTTACVLTTLSVVRWYNLV